MPCKGIQDRRVMLESSDKMWSTGEGNSKPLQYSCLENPMNGNTGVVAISFSRDLADPGIKFDSPVPHFSLAEQSRKPIYIYIYTHTHIYMKHLL